MLLGAAVIGGTNPVRTPHARLWLVLSMGLGGLQGFHLLRGPWSHGMLLMAHIWQWCAAHAEVSKNCGANPQHHHNCPRQNGRSIPRDTGACVMAPLIPGGEGSA